MIQRDTLVALVLLGVGVATHVHDLLPFEVHRDEQRYFYAMQGWQGLALALGLLYFGRALAPLSRALVYLSAIWIGVHETLVGACGTALFLSGRPYQQQGMLCYETDGWQWPIVGVCLILWLVAVTRKE